MRQHFLPFGGALAFFLLVYATSRFALWGLLLAALLSYSLYLGLFRWQGRLLAQGLSRAALERLAMREAWRRGAYCARRICSPSFLRPRPGPFWRAWRPGGYAGRRGRAFASEPSRGW